MRTSTTPRGLLAATVTLAALAATPAAHADEPQDPRRDAAYYRGRPNPGPSAADVALFVPRVALYPVHLVTEYVVRRPLVGLVGFAEDHHIPQYAIRVFNPTPDFSWAPVFQYDVGFAPTVGVGFRWQNFLFARNELRFNGATGGPDLIEVSAQDRVAIGDHVRIGVRGGHYTRPDRIYFGLGPRTRSDDLRRFALTRTDVFGLFDWRPSPHLRLELTGGYRAENTGPGRPPPLDADGVQTRMGGAPGFGQQMGLALGVAELTLDSRRDVLDYSGVRLATSTTFGHDTLNPARSFVVADAQLEGAVEIMRPGRVLVGSVYVADSYPLGSEPVPFTYLPTLGRAIHQGFRYGRWIGESAFVAELNYHYPIWSHADALWVASAGNVFGRHLQGFDVNDFTGTLGFGIRSRFERRPAIEALVAVGSTRFGDGLAIDSIRLYVGINRGL